MYCPRCGNYVMFASYDPQLCTEDQQMAFCRVCGWEPGDPPSFKTRHCGEWDSSYEWDIDEGEQTCLW